MSAHTPGPWQPWAGMSGQPLTKVARYHSFPGAYEVVADCSHAVTGSASDEANARLIAAAPDLLHALRHLLDASGPDGVNLDVWQKTAKAAIAKAELA